LNNLNHVCELCQHSTSYSIFQHLYSFMSFFLQMFNSYFGNMGFNPLVYQILLGNIL
jgi:hypothetical protein